MDQDSRWRETLTLRNNPLRVDIPKQTLMCPTCGADFAIVHPNPDSVGFAILSLEAFMFGTCKGAATLVIVTLKVTDEIANARMRRSVPFEFANVCTGKAGRGNFFVISVLWNNTAIWDI
jgi:hypothetical protein